MGSEPGQQAPFNEVQVFVQGFPKWWPVIMAIFAIFALGARADAEISENKNKIERLETVIPVMSDRLSRMEERSEAQTELLKRMDAKLDSLSQEQRETK